MQRKSGFHGPGLDSSGIMRYGGYMGPKTKKTGPDPLPKGRKRSHNVMVRMTPGDFRALRADAKREGLPLGEYLLRFWQERRG